MSEQKGFNKQKMYHYTLLLLEDLSRDSFKFIRYIINQEVKSLEQQAETLSKNITNVEDDELVQYKRRILDKRNKKEAYEFVLSAFLDEGFVRNTAQTLLEEIKSEEENNK